MGPNEFIRDCVIVPAQELYAVCNKVYKDVEDACMWLDRHFDVFTKAHLPPPTHHLAMSFFRTLPETFVFASCMSGFAAPAVFYCVVKIVVISWPHVKELIAQQFDAKLLGESITKTAKEFFATYENFTPAIALCAGTASVASVVFGFCTGNISSVMRAPLYAMVAYLAVSKILRDTGDEQIEGAPLAAVAAAPLVAGAGVAGAPAPAVPAPASLPANSSAAATG